MRFDRYEPRHRSARSVETKDREGEREREKERKRRALYTTLPLRLQFSPIVRDLSNRRNQIL